MGADKLSKELEQILLKKIAEDKLSLPTIPAVALRVLELLKDPEVPFKQAAQIMEQDPVLAARALRMATSAAFAAGTRKVTLGEALTRLGSKTLKSLLVEASAQKLFMSRDAKIAGALKRLWEHSVAVGTLARDIMALSGQTDSEAAYLAGLLHDVGKPIVAAVLLEAERQMTELYNRAFIDSGDWLEVVGRIHRPIGVSLAEKWQLPDAVSKCVKESTEYDNSDRNSLVNAVCFANALSKKIGIYAGPVAEEDNDALVMIGRSLIGISDDVLKTLTQGLRERVTGLYD
jgi:putative nucleotidyltransferase with HDIG domain